MKTVQEMDAVISQMRDKDELKVNYARTYQSVRDWLIMPPDKKGCGFDALFVDMLMPVVVHQIAEGKLKFESGKAFDLHLKERCMQFYSDLSNKEAEIRAELFANEHQYQQREGLNLLASLMDQKADLINQKTDLMDQIKSLKGLIKWLLITTVSLAAALSLDLAGLGGRLLLSSLLGVF